jgi:hypothetical protein
MRPVHPMPVILTALCFITIHTIAQNSVGKIILTKGQKIEINNNTKSVISQEMMGQVIEITVEANMVHQLEVIDKMDISLKVYQHFSAKFTTRREVLKLFQI